MSYSSKDKSPKVIPIGHRPQKNTTKQPLPPKSSKKQDKPNFFSKSNNNSQKLDIIQQSSNLNYGFQEGSIDKYLHKLERVTDFDIYELGSETTLKANNVERLVQAVSNRVYLVMGYAIDNLIQNNIAMNVEAVSQEEKFIEKLDLDSSPKKQGSQSSRKHSDKARSSVKIPSDKEQHSKTQKQIPASSRSMGSDKQKQSVSVSVSVSASKNERDASIDLSKYDPNDLKKIVLSEQTKQTLMKLQKYDKQFSNSVNNKYLKGVFDVQIKRQQKIKSINRNMKPIVFDNQLTIGFIMNILKYQGDLNKDVMEKQLLIEKNEELKRQINELKKVKNEEIKELKLAVRSKSNDEDGRNRVLDVEIKEFKKGNEVMVTAWKEKSMDKVRKVVEFQIKKLSSGANKQISFQRKQLLQIILDLLTPSDKLQPQSRNTHLSIQQINRIHTQLLPLFSPQSSIQKNISQLQKTRRHLQPKAHDTKLFEFKQLYQTMIQGTNYLMSLYQELREKGVEINTLSKKIAEIEKSLERSEKVKIESVERGEKVIEGLKDGLEKERRRSRENIKKMEEVVRSNKDNQGSGKQQSTKLTQYVEQWQSTLDTIVNKLKQQQSTWTYDIPNLRKRFSLKFQDTTHKPIFQTDLFLLQNISKKVKQLQKIEKSNQQLQKKICGSDRQLQFKPSEFEKKYEAEKEKNEQLLVERNALLKQLKQIQKSTDKTKKPQLQQVLSLNKVCYSIDSVLKSPFNADLWVKTKGRFLGSNEFKYLHSINTTLQNLFDRALQLSRKPMTSSAKFVKQAGLAKPVKQLIKENVEKPYSEFEEMNQFLELLKKVIEEEMELDRYVDLVNYLPKMLQFLVERMDNREENVKIGELMGVNRDIKEQEKQEIEGRGIEILSQNSMVQQKNPFFAQDPNPIDPNIPTTVSNISQPYSHKQSSHMSSHHNGSLNLQLSDIVLTKPNFELQFNRIKQELQTYQLQTKNKITWLEVNLEKEKEKGYYKGKIVRELEKEIEEMKVKEIEIKDEAVQLRREISEREKEMRKKIEDCQMKEFNLREAKTQIEEKLIKYQQIQQQILGQEHVSQTNFKQSQLTIRILTLQSQLVTQSTLLQTKQATQLQFKKYIQTLQDQIKTFQSVPDPSFPSPSPDQQIQSQNTLLRSDIQQLQLLLLQKDHQINNFYQLSQKYRLLFQNCCKQMEQMHNNTQQEMNSITEMHMRNQELLEEEIGVLRKERVGLSGKLRESQGGIMEMERVVKQEKMRVEEMDWENGKLRERVGQMEEEVKRIELLRNTNMSQSVKRHKYPKLSHTPSNQPQQHQLSQRLTTLLSNPSPQPLSKSALSLILLSLNKLLSSNKTLIDRIRRTQLQNTALYQAISQLTQNQQQFQHEGSTIAISIIAQLQQMVSNLVDWLQGMGSEQEMKLGHYFERLQDCMGKMNYKRYVEIFEEFVMNSVGRVYERGQEELWRQDKMIDGLKEKLVGALDQHLRGVIQEEGEGTSGSGRERERTSGSGREMRSGSGEEQEEGEVEVEGETKILNQVRILLSIYLKTRNLKVIQDLVGILDIEDVSFG